jgi:HAD superfamily hydrolase (TIGR01490 family)
MKELVIFDLDNTLVRGQSQELLINYLYRKGIVGTWYCVRIYLWFFLYKCGIVDNSRKVLSYAVRFLKGKNVFEVKNIIDDFLQNELRQHFFHEAVEIINQHRNSGREIVVVSGALEPLVSAIAQFFNIQYWIASQLDMQDNIYTGYAHSCITGKEKLESVKDFVKKHNEFSLNTTWAYADHHSDIPLLSTVAHPFAVNPNRKLQKYAAANKWPTLYFT